MKQSLSTTMHVEEQQQQQQQIHRQNTHKMTQDKDYGRSLSSSDPVAVREWLERQHRSKQLLTLVDKFLLELRQGQAADIAGSAASSKDKQATNMILSASDRRVLLVYKTVDLLKHLIGPTNWKSPAELLYLIRGIGRELHLAGGDKKEPAIGNVIRRVMAAVREEASSSASSAASSTKASTQVSSTETAGGGNRLTLQSMLWALPQHVRSSSNMSIPGGSSSRGVGGGGGDVTSSERSAETAVGRDYPETYYNSIRSPTELKASVMEAIQEIVADLEDSHKNINEQATNHIHAGEVILTCGGHSKTLELFLKAAAAASMKKQRGHASPSTATTASFQVIVCEDAPGNGGHAMAESLATAGIVTTVIPDAAVFALMSRVHKVLIPAHAVLANGGLVASSSGCNAVALAAHYNAVPVVCVTGIYKLCPLYPHDGQDTLNDLVSPSSIMDYATVTNGHASSSSCSSQHLFANVELVNPIHDYIQPDHVNLYVTNAGSFQPSYIYRLLAEYYHHDDWEAFD